MWYSQTRSQFKRGLDEVIWTRQFRSDFQRIRGRECTQIASIGRNSFGSFHTVTRFSSSRFNSAFPWSCVNFACHRNLVRDVVHRNLVKDVGITSSQTQSLILSPCRFRNQTGNFSMNQGTGHYCSSREVVAFLASTFDQINPKSSISRWSARMFEIAHRGDLASLPKRWIARDKSMSWLSHMTARYCEWYTVPNPWDGNIIDVTSRNMIQSHQNCYSTQLLYR
jgi:hypothetical protein